MKKSDLFNDESICIFTDSSFKNQSKDRSVAVGTTAPAFCIYNGDKLIDQGFSILHNSTSQKGELYAVLLGIMRSYFYRDYKHIRLFSDSMNSIFAIRERIFTWVRSTNNGGNVLGENGRINNQDYIMDIIYYIISNNIPIEFFHVKGHVNPRFTSDIKHSTSVFKFSNNVIGHVDEALIYQLAEGNNYVDLYSTTKLKQHLNNPLYFTDGLTPALTIGYAPFDMSNYLSLVNHNPSYR